MKCVIIADIHDNLATLKTCLDWANKNGVEQIISCGDTTTLETLQFIVDNFLGKIFAILGNCDFFEAGEADELDRVECPGRIGVLEIGKQVIGVCHEQFYIETVQRITQCDMVFYGHTHKPWIETGNTKNNLVNPGTLGGVFQRATFTFWDTESGALELKIVDTL